MFLRTVGNYLGDAASSIIRGVVEPGYFAQQKALRKLGFQDDGPKIFRALDGRILKIGVNRDHKRYEAHFDDNGQVTLITITPGHFPTYLGHDGTRQRRMTQLEEVRFLAILHRELTHELSNGVLHQSQSVSGST